MPPPRLQCLSRASNTPLLNIFRSQLPPTFLAPLIIARPASHAAQGRANKAAPGPGKRLGAKKGASELVVPGNIIFRQRGTHWFPGENCGMGRDHTIFAKEKGYVTFYRDPERNKERKYIGVVFERGSTLPVPRNAPRRRRLGMISRGREMSTSTPPMASQNTEAKDVNEAPESSAQLDGKTEVKALALARVKLRSNYQYRESNWSIGRAAERAGVKVRRYDKRDRFLAWRKREENKKKIAERKMLSSRKKKGSSK